VKLWRINFADYGELFELLASITEHEGFVNSVALLPGTPEYPEGKGAFVLIISVFINLGVILSGGQDKLINVWDCRERRICGTLIGHEGNVCKLVAFEEASFPFVVGSCSWDGSVRCWTGEFSEVNSLRLDAGPLSGSCWSVCGCGPDSFVTAHADRSIRVWRGDREVQVISGAHDDVVRDVVRISDGDGLFVSVGNDGAVALWNSLFECIDRVPCAHPAFIYGCCYSSTSGLVATFGEEGLVKLWRLSLSGGLVLDSEFQVPMTSVWSVAFVSGSRLLVTGSTGAMFLFSSAASDWQDATVFTAELDAFTAGAAASKASEIEKNVLAASVLRCPGERVGKTVLVRSDAGAIEAHQWTGSEWTNHGQVIDPSSVKAPDFTFSVQLDDTNRSYSLPYNLDENPYSVAKNFLDRNDLPQTHLDEVAAFIIKNSGATAAVEQVKADEAANANANEKVKFW
jgi:phospholipase A-2-activating protein